MLLSIVRASVLGLLEEHGPVTTDRLLALDQVLNAGTPRPLFLTWLRQSYISRELIRVGTHPMYRYAITKRGRAVLAGHRVDPDALVTPKEWTRRELVLDGSTYTIEEAAQRAGVTYDSVRCFATAAASAAVRPACPRGSQTKAVQLSLPPSPFGDLLGSIQWGREAPRARGGGARGCKGRGLRLTSPHPTDAPLGD